MSEIKSRYPQFTNPDLFTALCDQLESSGNISQANKQHLRRFHYSIEHKLTSAIFSLEEIRRIVRTGSHIPQLTSTGTTTVQSEFEDNFKIIFYQDTFFSSLISSFDILSLKLNLIYGNPIPNIRNCYFGSLVDTLVQSNASGIVEIYLDNIRNTPWYQDTCPFRICLTHRQQPDYIISISVVAGVPTIKHFLPDDPLTLPYTYNGQIENVPFCQDKIDHFVDAINDIDGLLTKEAQRIRRIPF